MESGMSTVVRMTKAYHFMVALGLRYLKQTRVAVAFWGRQNRGAATPGCVEFSFSRFAVITRAAQFDFQ